MRSLPFRKPDNFDFRKMRQHLAASIDSAISSRQTVSDIIHPKKADPLKQDQVIIVSCPSHEEPHQELVVDLSPEAEVDSHGWLTKMASGVRKALAPILIPAAVVMASGCGTIYKIAGFGKSPQQRMTQAYEEGDYPEALNWIKELDQKQLSESDKAKLLEIQSAAENLAKHYLLRAKGVAGNRQIQRNNYLQAIQYCRGALELLSANNPNRKLVEEELSSLEKALRDFEKEYDGLNASLDKYMKVRNFTDESMRELNIVFERLRVLRIALRKEDTSLYYKALDLAKKLSGAKNMVAAYELCRIARAMDFSEGEITWSTQVTQIDEAFIQRVSESYNKEMERRANEVERLSQLTFSAFNGKDMSEVRRLIGEVGKLNAAAANRLALKINKMSRSSRRPSASRKSVVIAAALAASADAPSPAVEESGDLEEVRLTLDNLISQFKSGEKYEAIAGLEEAIAEFSGSSNLSILSRQRAAWDSERQKLINDRLGMAEKLYVEVATEGAPSGPAIQAYREVLRLNPSEKIRGLAENRIRDMQ